MRCKPSIYIINKTDRLDRMCYDIIHICMCVYTTRMCHIWVSVLKTCCNFTTISNSINPENFTPKRYTNTFSLSTINTVCTWGK